MAPSALGLTPEERIAYPFLFAKADTDQIGVLVGEKAVAFFAHSKLPPTVLGEIWQLADQENVGFLTRNQFDIALRLIGKAQRGVPINQAAISTPGPICRLEGINIPGLAQPTSPLPTGARVLSTSSPVPSSAAGNPLGTIGAEDKAKYARMFHNAGPVDGLLDGDKARDIFVRSKLSFEKLGQIWTLADTHSRGALSVGDFCIAMHLIQLCMSGRLSTLPATLPPAFLESVSTVPPGTPSPLLGQLTGQPLRSSLPPVNPQRTGSIGVQYTGHSTSAGPASLPSVATPTNMTSPTLGPWDISSSELSQSNTYFDTLDLNRQGFITGDRAVPFMMESKLPGEVLAKIWDLADIRGEGKLTREEFAVALRLIQDVLANGLDSLPPQLPISMVPPSLRRASAGMSAIPEVSDTQRDLLSLMDDDEPAPAPASTAAQNISAQVTGASFQATPLSNQPTGVKSISPALGVVSHESFTQSTLAPQVTGALPPQLTDRSITHSPSLATLTPMDDSGAKLGNLHTQLTSTTNALGQAVSEKSRLQEEVGSTAEQIKSLELKLAAARASLQAEAPHIQELRTRQAEQRTELGNLTKEVIAAESELSALRLEKSQIENLILRDKEEVRDTKKKVSELEEETRKLKVTLETLKKDSRLQKGLLAIGKKQVATVEGHAQDVNVQIQSLQEQLSAAASQSGDSRATTPAFVTPMMTGSLPQKSTNPFDRLMSSPIDQTHAFGLKPGSPIPPDLNISRQVTGTHETTEDPFSTNLPLSDSGHSAGGLSFGDAFGFDDHPKISSDSNVDPQSTFDNNPSRQEAPPVTSPPAILPPSGVGHSSNMSGSQSSNRSLHRHEPDDESDKSSDEDEIEDATASRLPRGTTTIEPGLDAHQFPPLEDVQLLIDPHAERSKSHQQAASSPEENFYTAVDETAGHLTARDLRETDSLNDVKNNPVHSQRSRTQSPVSERSSVKVDRPTSEKNNAAGFANFGDDLEISDFAAGFGTVTPKVSRATLEDFDSAFASLPPPTSKSSQRMPTIEPQKSSFAAFDDTFGDSFGGSTNKAEKGFGFEDSFKEFDSEFDKKLKFEDKQTIEESKVSNSVAPSLPARPSNSTINQLDLPKDDDSDAVKQICAMGFGRKVAIEALEKDEWNMERALNHLLG